MISIIASPNCIVPSITEMPAVPEVVPDNTEIPALPPAAAAAPAPRSKASAAGKKSTSKRRAVNGDR